MEVTSHWHRGFSPVTGYEGDRGKPFKRFPVLWRHSFHRAEATVLIKERRKVKVYLNHFLERPIEMRYATLILLVVLLIGSLVLVSPSTHTQAPAPKPP